MRTIEDRVSSLEQLMAACLKLHLSQVKSIGLLNSLNLPEDEDLREKMEAELSTQEDLGSQIESLIGSLTR